MNKINVKTIQMTNQYDIQKDVFMFSGELLAPRHGNVSFKERIV